MILRQELAGCMGYASFAHMAMVGKMAHTPEAARQLLEVLSLLALLPLLAFQNGAHTRSCPAASRGAQFTCFTSKKVQLLTPEELQDLCQGLRSRALQETEV